MKIPRNVSPAAEARRSWLIDVVIGIFLGIFAIILAAGVGVVAFFALLVAILIVAWYVVEGVLRLRRRRSGGEVGSGTSRTRAGRNNWS